MEDTSNVIIDRICRTCMCESSNMTSLFSKIDGDHTLSELLNFITNINVRISDKLPKQICAECELILRKTEDFRQRCIASEASLSKIIGCTSRESDASHIIENCGVKLEITIETDDKSVREPYQCSICLAKFSNITFLESHISSSHFAITDSFDDTFSRSKHDSLLGKVDEPTVKQDILDDFGDQNDYEDNNFDIVPIEKVENGEISEQNESTCSYDEEDSYKLHLETNSCDKFKPNLIYEPIKPELPEHIKNNSDIQIKHLYVCKKCNLQFKTKKGYNIHQRRHEKDKKSTANSQLYQCSMCMRKFTRKSSFTTHIRNHEARANVNYTCNTCKREFKHQAHLDNHILSVHTREKGLTCELCTNCFATQESLDIHRERHKIEKKHQCKTCNKSFYMLSTLTDHIRTHTGEKPFLCSTCGKGFSQKTNLEQHIRRHQGLKPFKCDTCDRRFVSKGELVAHNRKHSGAHPFICDDCGNGFTTSSSLVKHRRTHTGERPYACDLCTMRFAASGTLKNHRRTHTGEKPFQCSYCEKAFVQRQDLISHIRCHTGEKPFICSTCGQSFRKGTALKTHVKTHSADPSQLHRDVLQGVNSILTGLHCDISHN